MPKLYFFAMSLLLAFAATVPAGEARVAFVNVSYIFENYDMVPDVQKKLDEKYKTRKDELEKRAEDLYKRNNELEPYIGKPKPSEAIFDAIQRLHKDQFLYERDLDLLNSQIQGDHRAQMREVLGDIRSAIKDIAEARKFELVFRSPDADDPPPAEGQPANPAQKDEKKTFLQLNPAKTSAELVARFNRNPVLHGKDSADITRDVLARVNEVFKQRIRKEK